MKYGRGKVMLQISKSIFSRGFTLTILGAVEIQEYFCNVISQAERLEKKIHSS